MKKVWEAINGNVPFYILAGISAALLIAGFLCPPLAVIDKSVLLASGELMGWGALFTLLIAIEKGTAAKVSHNNTTIEVGQNDEK